MPSPLLADHDTSPVPTDRDERHALIDINPCGFHIRHPPKPHLLNDAITPDNLLFQTIHMGAAVIDPSKWTLVVDGLVESPFSISLDQLERLPQKSVTSFHECYGSPIKPPVEAVWRVGNVIWTGVPLAFLISLASPLPEARFVWSDGLDYGTFAGITTDRYQKDLPLDKAQSPGVLIAYQMNGQALTKERGGPVRLVVPGWFGTNSTKWLCRLTLENRRAEGPYTTTFYNELDPTDPKGISKQPVWNVEVNSIIVRPEPEAVIVGAKVVIEGWAWCFEEVKNVGISFDNGETWIVAQVEGRIDFSWQKWKTELTLASGSYSVIAQAESISGQMQPLSGRRNHVHAVSFSVSGSPSEL
ncbi:hypothetical protein AU210_013547 [Fusarium oxysporum f. sp. radicis-cucumerinum]|uniref:Sulfite oxidase n=2 Tax=Fusarium oxysporum TaxID=5507 RepID=A0A2H3GSQ2_FUSOX|nr:hypothetical protein AU210_013547 [Fusarium oxysporum f. sp. radicis-cucumerinum]RKK95910.1 hypothetical protein BFJ71_g8087 [Fusarium oxysporum]RKK98529.1 hypothetical protein BFJ68_g13603 [Fusarium oxysporum]